MFISITTLKAQNPVAHYPFNGDANDISGNGYHGVVYNAKLAVDRYSIPNKSYYFDGSGDYIVFPNKFDFPQKTISLWFNAETISTTTDYMIIGNYQGSIVYTQFGIDVREGNKLHIAVGNVGGSTIISTKKWYHVALVINDNEYRFFVNGELRLNDQYPVYHSSDENSGTRVGTNRKYNGAFFNGYIDEIKIYNTALSDVQVYQFYDQYYEKKTKKPSASLQMVINNHVVNNIKIYPNPFTGNLYFNGLGTNHSISIFDNNGNLILKSPATEHLNVEFLRPGMYFVLIENSEGVILNRKKLVRLQ